MNGRVFLRRAVGVLRVGLFMVSGVAFSSPVLFSIDYTDEAETGFYDPVLGEQRQSAFAYACSIWSDYLEAGYEGETITVSASFTAMGGSETNATLGSAGPNGFYGEDYGVGPTGYLWLNSANANHVFGGDQNSEAAEISAQFNSDVDTTAVLGGTDFYYGLDGNAGGDVDFVSVLLHEIGHGLGFTSLADSDSGAYTTLHSAIPNTPTIYDRFLVLDDGINPVAPLVDMTDEERLVALTSENLFWNGVSAMAANGGELVQIYAPDPWETGSSISHLDESACADALMSPIYSGITHTPDALTLGMLSDMGWTVIPEPSTVVVMLLFGGGMLGIRRFFSM